MNIHIQVDSLTDLFTSIIYYLSADYNVTSIMELEVTLLDADK